MLKCLISNQICTALFICWVQLAPVNYPAICLCVISASFSYGLELGLLPSLLQQKLLSVSTLLYVLHNYFKILVLTPLQSEKLRYSYL